MYVDGRTSTNVGVATRSVITVSAQPPAASRAQDKTRSRVVDTKHSTSTPSTVRPVLYTLARTLTLSDDLSDPD